MDNHYELLYIVSIKHIGDELQKAMETVAKMIKDNNGEITLDDILGKQKLAFPIKNVHQGTYVVVEFNMPRENMLELDKQLKLMPEILRHMIIVKRIKSAEEIEHEKKVAERLLQRKEEELAKAEGIEVKKEEAAPKEETSEEVKEEVVAEEKSEEPKKEEKVEKVKSEEENTSKPEEKKEDEKEKTEVKEKEAKSKVSLDDLDKKLDEILTDDII